MNTQQSTELEKLLYPDGFWPRVTLNFNLLHPGCCDIKDIYYKCG